MSWIIAALVALGWPPLVGASLAVGARSAPPVDPADDATAALVARVIAGDPP